MTGLPGPGGGFNQYGVRIFHGGPDLSLLKSLPKGRVKVGQQGAVPIQTSILELTGWNPPKVPPEPCHDRVDRGDLVVQGIEVVPAYVLDPTFQLSDLLVQSHHARMVLRPTGSEVGAVGFGLDEGLSQSLNRVRLLKAWEGYQASVIGRPGCGCLDVKEHGGKRVPLCGEACSLGLKLNEASNLLLRLGLNGDYLVPFSKSLKGVFSFFQLSLHLIGLFLKEGYCAACFGFLEIPPPGNERPGHLIQDGLSEPWVMGVEGDPENARCPVRPRDTQVTPEALNSLIEQDSAQEYLFGWGSKPQTLHTFLRRDGEVPSGQVDSVPGYKLNLD
jgi:hypothetical protein